MLLLDIQSTKKKHFGCLHHHRYIHNDWYDSPYPIFPCCIECSTILKFVRIVGLIHFHQPLCHFNIYSPQSTSLALNRYSVFIPWRKNCKTARRMASESSADLTNTSTSSDSSTATSKVSVKAIRLLVAPCIGGRVFFFLNCFQVSCAAWLPVHSLFFLLRF